MAELYALPTELVRRSDGARSVLDRIEGHRTDSDPENYVPARVAVELRAGSFEALDIHRSRRYTRAMSLEHRDTTLSEDYARAILDGAASLRLPEAYVSELRAAIAATATGV